MKSIFSIFILLLSVKAYSSECSFMSKDVNQRIADFQQRIIVNQQHNVVAMRAAREQRTELDAYTIELNRGQGCFIPRLTWRMMSDMSNNCDFSTIVNSCQYDERIDTNITGYNSRMRSLLEGVTDLESPSGPSMYCTQARVRSVLQQKKSELEALNSEIINYKAQIVATNTACNESIEANVLNTQCINSFKAAGHEDVDKEVADFATERCTREQVGQIGVQITEMMTSNADRVCAAVSGHQRSVASTRRLINMNIRLGQVISDLTTSIADVERSIASIGGAGECN